MNQKKHNQTKSPCSTRLSISPPASLTALIAACDSFLRFSKASFSLLAFVLDEPLGATPVRIFLLSLGVKLTKSTVSGIDGVRGVEFSLFFGDFRFLTGKVGEGEPESLDPERFFRIGLDDCGCLEWACALWRFAVL